MAQKRLLEDTPVVLNSCARKRGEGEPLNLDNLLPETLREDLHISSDVRIARISDIAVDLNIIRHIAAAESRDDRYSTTEGRSHDRPEPVISWGAMGSVQTLQGTIQHTGMEEQRRFRVVEPLAPNCACCEAGFAGHIRKRAEGALVSESEVIAQDLVEAIHVYCGQFSEWGKSR